MTLNELLEKNEYENLKFQEAVYDEQTDTTTFCFLYPACLKPTDETKNLLKEDLSKLMNNVSKLKLKFKQSYVDKDVLFQVVCDFVERECPYLKGFANQNDFHVVLDNAEQKLSLTFDCDDEMNTILQTYKFFDLLKKHLSKFVFEEIEIKSNVCKQAPKKNASDEKTYAMQLEDIFAQEKLLNKIQVDEVSSVVGKIITQSPIFVKDAVQDEPCVLAGTLTNPMMTFYVPKSQKESENPEKKKKFSFDLVDASGSLRVVMFPNDKDAEKLEKLTENCEVLIGGKLNLFNESKSFRAFDLSVCKVLTKEIKYIWRDPISNYKTVVPEPMQDMQQMSLFAGLENVSEYWNNNKEVVVFDFETTGLNADTCKIIEIGAVKVRNGKCVETFSTLINPHEKLEPEIVNLTGITDEMLVFAPEIEDVLPDFHKFVQNCVLSAYNIGFDIKFLLNAGQKFRFKFDNEKIDTLELVRQKVPSLPNYKLSSAVKALNVTLEEAHRALNDAIATAKVFIKLV